MPKASTKIPQPPCDDTVIALLGEIRTLNKKCDALSDLMTQHKGDRLRWAALDTVASGLMGRIAKIEMCARLMPVRTLAGALVQVALVRGTLSDGQWSEEVDADYRDSCIKALDSAALIIEAQIGELEIANGLHDGRYLCGPNDLFKEVKLDGDAI